MKRYTPYISLTTDERALYYEVFGVPFHAKSTLIVPKGDSFILDNMLDLIPRSCDDIVDYEMGSSGIVQEYIDHYLERTVEKYEDRLKSNAQYHKELRSHHD